jgi:hypothetical protein
VEAGGNLEKIGVDRRIHFKGLLKEIEREGVAWTHVSYDTEKGPSIVNALMKHQVP